MDVVIVGSHIARDVQRPAATSAQGGSACFIGDACQEGSVRQLRNQHGGAAVGKTNLMRSLCHSSMRHHRLDNSPPVY